MLVRDSEYRHQGVERLRAGSALELVRRLNETARIPKPTAEDYMRTVSTIHQAEYDEPLKTATAAAFVEDLVERGMLEQDGDWWSILF